MIRARRELFRRRPTPFPPPNTLTRPGAMKELGRDRPRKAFSAGKNRRTGREAGKGPRPGEAPAPAVECEGLESGEEGGEVP